MKRQKNILCYGDSNTWGFIAGSIDFKTFYMERYPRNVRWTGLLQQYLGHDFYVIEEGLNGRTTNLDYKDIPGRNGKTHLGPCLYSHAPLDLVILSLGANDLKIEFDRDAQDISKALSELIDIIQTSTFGSDMQNSPPILLVNYPIPTNENYLDMNDEAIFKGAIEKAKKLPHVLSKLAIEKQCYFFDPSPYIQLSKIDGIHFDKIAHKKFAELILIEIKKIF
ncbi:MAG: SGNH/GDSL hydrolase family protein [Gammaproteobacteria bacterium]|nr:SGNH/GDSL hydrolase family protein [Gammaproteobacteria bacterium]MCW5584009.1 SGNH/GDSL hydrolase family protein [Gammaproteobacteria bacterium]